MRRILQSSLVLVLAVPLMVWAMARGGADAAVPTPKTVMFVGNNWDGTADVIDATTYKRLKRIDVIPDREERLSCHPHQSGQARLLPRDTTGSWRGP